MLNDAEEIRKAAVEFKSGESRPRYLCARRAARRFQPQRSLIHEQSIPVEVLHRRSGDHGIPSGQLSAAETVIQAAAAADASIGVIGLQPLPSFLRTS